VQVKKLQNTATEIFGSKVVIHVIFILFVILLFFLIAIVSGLPVSKIFRIFVFCIFILICIYAGRWNSRRWLFSNKLIQLALYSIVTIIAFTVIGSIGVKYFSNNLNLAIVITISGFVIIFFLLGILLSIGRTTILRQIREASINQQQRESELHLLRSQLSPHFLFNVLNSLYGLSLAEDKKVPGLLLKLSDLLRYSIYDTRQDFVPLANELAYIDNYIELEKIRIGDRLSFVSNIQKENIEDITIAPMLLIVFIENAFKHSKNSLLPEIQIETGLRIIDDKLIFTVKNSYVEPTSEYISDEVPGIGLAVTLKRLELLYPGNYSLEKTKENDYYQVKLQLNIK
jgi:sensor histidine kinase YesM